ncbi:bacteriophage holin [Legionella yabuuchiae]|uniref:bacteriophage holin n=1 Tax=Legionella yabuuchiae TaxID=376727 RepID=UPI00105463EE|nr:bacteriophage holin [Legionella yabuuchiae]
MNRLKLSPLALGLSLGIFWGISVLLLGLLSYFFTFGEVFVNSIGTLYIGYESTILGSIIGGIIGFIDAFICGLIIAWLYNLFVK